MENGQTGDLLRDRVLDERDLLVHLDPDGPDELDVDPELLAGGERAGLDDLTELDAGVVVDDGDRDLLRSRERGDDYESSATAA